MAEGKKREIGIAEEKKHEIQSLNIGELDVEELEQRLELATAGVDGDCWMMDCGTFGGPLDDT